MAPFQKRRYSSSDIKLSNKKSLDKENFVSNFHEFQSRIRRRESIRGLRMFKEHELEQKIDLEIKMREGITKLLQACRHQTQTLEAAKSLLTSSERMVTYMTELQRRKRESFVSSNNQPCKARVSLSDLRIPLIWRDSDHFKNKGDYRRFAVFCLARIGTEIYDTSLLCPVDRSQTDISFPDVLLFNGIPADFTFRLEVYSHILQDDLSIASTPHKIKKTIHTSISRTVGKKLAASLKDGIQSGNIGPQFNLMATAQLTLDDIDDAIRTHDLQIQNIENKNHQLPLFGHFCCRLAAQPECVSQESCSGSLMLFEGGRWNPVWGQLQAFHLDLWSTRLLWEQGQDPLYSVTVERKTLIQAKDAKSQEITISNPSERNNKIVIIKAQTASDQRRWIRALVQHTKDHLRWRHASERIMEIQSPTSKRQSFTRGLRHGSLYDETPVIVSQQPDHHRPTVHEVFGLTPSTSLSSCTSSSSSPSFRSSSSSSSSSSSTRTNSNTHIAYS